MRSFFRLPTTDREFAEKADIINPPNRLGHRLGIAARFVPHAMAKRTPPKEDFIPIVHRQSADGTSSEEKKMKKWPDDPTELIAYEKLVFPLKDILRRGYRLFRKDEVVNFDYDGYDIGKLEREFYPPPNYRFTEKFLKEENFRGKKLMDVVLSVMFLLGVEQGRRAERKSFKPMEILLETLDSYRESNKDLRLKVDELEVKLEIKESNPEVSADELNRLIQEGMKQRRERRIEQAKMDLSLDSSRSGFEFIPTQRARFIELERIACSLTKETCTLEQWQEILQQKGWTHKEWKAKCKKKHLTILFS
jgi:hypothetical protein